MLTFPGGTEIVTVVLRTLTLTSTTATIKGKFVLDGFSYIEGWTKLTWPGSVIPTIGSTSTVTTTTRTTTVPVHSTSSAACTTVILAPFSSHPRPVSY